MQVTRLRLQGSQRIVRDPRRSARIERGADHQIQRIRPAPRTLEEEAAAAVREDAAPHAIEHDRLEHLAAAVGEEVPGQGGAASGEVNLSVKTGGITSAMLAPMSSMNQASPASTAVLAARNGVDDTAHSPVVALVSAEHSSRVSRP